MKKTILYTIAAISIAAIAAIVIVGCNSGDGGNSDGLNNFLGSFVNRDPGPNPDGNRYRVTVENGRTSTGADNYAVGETVIIIANDAPNSRRFKEWTSSSGAAIANPENSTTSFTMPPREVTVTASFRAIPQYTVTYNGNGNDGGSVPTDHDSPYDSGATVTVLGSGDLTKSGYYFSSWNTQNDGSGRQFGVGEPFTITGPTTLFAIWTPNGVESYNVTVTGGSGGGSYTPGQPVTVRADIVGGYTFKHWTSNPNVDFNDATSPTATFTMPSSDVEVTAYIEQIPSYLLTVNISPANSGNVSIYPTNLPPVPGGYSCQAGTDVTATATAENGYRFDRWEGVTDTSYIMNIRVNENTTLTAIFVPTTTTQPTQNYKLTVNIKPENSGTVALNPTLPDNIYPANTPVTAKATAAPGYRFIGWSDESNASEIITVPMDMNRTLTANFEPTVIWNGMLDDFEDGTNMNALGGYWYFYTHLTANAAIANPNPTSCNIKTYSNYITEDDLERIKNADIYWPELIFRGGYVNDRSISTIGNYSGVMEFENMKKPWTSPGSQDRNNDVYPGVGMGTFLTTDTQNGVGESFRDVTAIRFWMKVSDNVKIVGFKVETVDQYLPQSSWTNDGLNSRRECPADNSHQVYLQTLDTNWKQYTVKISDLIRNPNWEKNKPYTFDITRALKIVWFVNEENGAVFTDGMVAVDNIEIVGYTPR
ncbi:MAG: InlB B-repeat-containing protein [Chitinispirillales bacterium]|jgi:uncharacterized repeat protein (TIGR02543 family)|nr:InlB B-repeat-containing protein [Chitinispirillales bacterium]